MDISVDLAGLKLEHPLTNAAGTCKHLDEVELLAKSHTAAIMVGSATLKGGPGNTGRIYHFDGITSINGVNLANPGGEYYRKYLQEMVMMAHDAGKPLFFSGAGESPFEYAELALLAANGGADLFEINLGCPNRTDGNLKHKAIPSYNPELVEEILYQTSQYLGPRQKMVVGVKVSASLNFLEIPLLAKAITQGGSVKVVSGINTLAMGVRFQKDKTGKLQRKMQIVPQLNGFGGLAGPGIKDLALGQIVLWREALPDHIQIIGMGGISRGENILEFRWAGADVVAVATAILNKDRQLKPRVLAFLLREYKRQLLNQEATP